jgi:hypothetical protein
MPSIVVFATICTVIAFELSVRAIKRWPNRPKAGRAAFQIFRSLRAASDQHERLCSMEPHPFLQFTGPRRALPNGDQEYGFPGIKLSDVPKPEGVVRIACLGGLIADGVYRASFEGHLNDALSATRFQVLDFAVDGWSSVHNMLNFILNVRDFRPDIVVVSSDGKDAVCTGYPCTCIGQPHHYAPLPFPPHSRHEWLLGTSFIYGATCAILKRVRNLGARRRFNRESFQNNDRALNMFRRNIGTICTLAAIDRIKIILLTTPPMKGDHRQKGEDDYAYGAQVQARNEIVRAIAKETVVALVDLDLLMTENNEPFGDSLRTSSARAAAIAATVGEAILADIKLPQQENRH